MKIIENKNGTFTFQSETEKESQVINIVYEMAVLAYRAGEMGDDDVNNMGCHVVNGEFLNYCTIPSMKWVVRIAEECSA